MIWRQIFVRRGKERIVKGVWYKLVHVQQKSHDKLKWVAEDEELVQVKWSYESFYSLYVLLIFQW